MATENEQLVLSISADTRQILRQLKGLVGQTQRDTKALTDLFGNVDKAASGAFDGVAANSNRAFTIAVNGGRRYQEAMKASTVQTGNLAAQLNDIGVQLAGGQSPLLIALQQGSQITQALGSGTGARGAVSALAGAFTSLLNPVSLATIAIIALGGSAVQYFTSLLESSEEVVPAIKEQENLIRSIAERWGEAIPPLKEYVAELDRAKLAAEAQQGGKIVADEQWLKVRDELAAFNSEFDEYVTAITIAGNATGTQRTALSDLGTAFVELESKVKDGTAAQEDFDRVRAAATQAAAMEGASELDVFVEALGRLAAAVDGPLAKLRELRPLLTGQARLLDPSTWRGAGNIINGADGPIQNPGFMTPENGPTPESRPLIELTGLPKTRGGGGRSKAISDAEREKKAVADLIEQLEFEQSILGATDVEREVANALRRAGAAATDEQRAKIEQLVEATYAEREALKANKEAMQELQNVAKDVLGGIISDLRAGKSGADILSNALDRVISKLLDGALDSFISNIFGGMGAGRRGGLLGGFIIPGILHSGGVAGKDGYGHGRAVSPSVFRGARRYHSGGIAGLAPGEVPAILQRGEVVIPRGGKMRGGAETITVNLAADRSVIAETADQRIQTASGTIVQVAVQQSTQRVVPTMARYQNDKAGAEWRG